MCSGCPRVLGSTCSVIKEPRYFYQKYGKCFARVSPERAVEIDVEIQRLRGVIA